MTETPSVESAPMSGLFARAYRDIIGDRLRLPSMPDVAIRIRAAMQREDIDVGRIARVIQADPGTAAYLVRIANSPVYRGVVAIKSVENAVSRLGMNATRNLVTAHALRAMFNTRSAVLASVMRETWQRSAKLAALASVVAQHCPGFEPDRAMLAGLLQDIGVLPLLNTLEDTKAGLPDRERIASSLDAFCAKVGVVLLRTWDFDDEIIEVAQSRKDWQRDPGPTADLADLVLVARMHACVGTERGSDMPAIIDVPAFGKLPLGEVGVDARLNMLLEADSDVREMMRMLGV